MCPVANPVFRNRVTVNLPTPIECPKSCDMYASVVDAQIPNTYNTVDDRNSAVTFTFRFGTLSSQQAYSFPSNNYTTATLASTFGATKGFTFSLGGAACSMTVGLSIFNAVGAPATAAVFRVALTAATGTPAGAGPGAVWSGVVHSPLLGFYDQGFQTTPVSGSVPALSLRHYIIASTLSTFNQLPTTAGYEAPVKVLCKVPCTAAPNFTEQFLNPGASPLKIANRVVESFEIAVLDDFAKDINLRSADWSCTVQIEFLPRILDGPNYWVEKNDGPEQEE